MDRKTVDTMQKIREMKNFGVLRASLCAYPTRDRETDATQLARLPMMLLPMVSACAACAGSMLATRFSYQSSTRSRAGSMCSA